MGKSDTFLRGRKSSVYWPIKRLRGRSRSLLLQEQANGNRWVFKPDNGEFLLENEFVGRYIFSSFGLPVPQQRITDGYIEYVPGLWTKQDEVGWREGKKHLLLAYLSDEAHHVVFDKVPLKLSKPVINIETFLVAFLLDTCLCNTDARQAVFVDSGAGLAPVFIDHSHLFGGQRGELLGIAYRVLPYRSFAQFALQASENREALSGWIIQLSEYLPRIASEAYRALPQEWARRDSQEILECIELRLERLQNFVTLEMERLRIREEELCRIAMLKNW